MIGKILKYLALARDAQKIAMALHKAAPELAQDARVLAEDAESSFRYLAVALADAKYTAQEKNSFNTKAKGACDRLLKLLKDVPTFG
jgi:hypothetical protein